MSDNLRTTYTAEDWHERFGELNYDSTMLLGYMECASLSAAALIRILEVAKDFDDLKKQVLEFAKEQQALVRDIDKKWQGDDPEKYDLPRMYRPDIWYEVIRRISNKKSYYTKNQNIIKLFFQSKMIF